MQVIRLFIHNPTGLKRYRIFLDRKFGAQSVSSSKSCTSNSKEEDEKDSHDDPLNPSKRFRGYKG